MKPEPVSIAIFAKAPVPGLCKTRMIPALGKEGAARLQQWLTRRTLAHALAAGTGPVVMCCAPDASHPFFAEAVGQGARLAVQHGPDLGARMHAAFEEIGGPVILIGSDCPAMSASHLAGVAERLRAGEEAVIIPAEDGGYVLIALRRPRAELFTDIPWGTERVFALTCERAEAAGIPLAVLPPLWDVDVTADLVRLVAAFPDAPVG